MIPSARRLAGALLASLAALIALSAPLAASAQANPTYRFTTNFGDIDVTLRPGVAPATVANFLSYVGSGAYTNSIIHRSVPGFVIQGGGYVIAGSNIDAITTAAAIQNESSLSGHLSNVRGTIAMALSGTDINSATSQWYFNLADNSTSLDAQHFTVFGQVANAASLAVMDSIAAARVIDLDASLPTLPVYNYPTGTSPTVANLVTLSAIALVANTGTPDYAITASPQALTITAGQSASTTLTITPSNAYAGTITLACGTLPASASCTFAPTSVTFASTDTAAKTATLTIATAARAAAPAVGSAGDGGAMPPLARTLLALLALLAAVGILSTRRGPSLARRLRGLARPAAFALAAASLASCGGSDSAPATTTTTPTEVYSVPVTITDGTTAHPIALSVTVQ